MKTDRSLEKKDSKNKRKMLFVVTAGVIVIGGMAYVIVRQQGDIKALKRLSAKNEADVKLLKEVVHGNVIHSLRESYKRKLRYAEGRLTTGIAKGSGMSAKDINLRKEEIEFFSKQLENLDAAEALLDP